VVWSTASQIASCDEEDWHLAWKATAQFDTQPPIPGKAW